MDSLKLPAACRTSSMGSTDFGEVAALVTAYTDYLQALTGLCGRGVQLIRNFVGPCSVAYMLPTKEKEDAQKLWAFWEDINKSMQQSVWSVRTQSVQSLQEWLQQKSKESKSQEPLKTSNSDDISKLITTCLVAFTQLQHQFSALCCHSFMELDLIKMEENGTDMAGANSISPFCEREIDKERRDSGNVSDDLAHGSSADLLFTQMQLGRRSSYELGNLHTTSPPPPSASSLGRRWSMPTEDIVLKEHKISPQFNGVLEKKRETLVSHEELDSVINLLSFSHCGPAPPPSKSSNLGVKSLSPASKLDNLSLPPPSRGCPTYGILQRHEQQPLDTRSWSSSKNCVPKCGGGLLTVASMVSADCKETKLNRKNYDVHSGSSNTNICSVNLCSATTTNCSEYQQALMMSLGANDGGVNKKGAFSIGLNLVGSDLMASVQQRQNNEEMKSNLPQIKVPETNSKQKRVQPTKEPKWKPNDPAGYKEAEIQSSASEFLPFSLDASPGSNIWTPSQNDYTSPGGNYYFQVGP